MKQRAVIYRQRGDGLYLDSWSARARRPVGDHLWLLLAVVPVALIVSAATWALFRGGH